MWPKTHFNAFLIPDVDWLVPGNFFTIEPSDHEVLQFKQDTADVWYKQIWILRELAVKVLMGGYPYSNSVTEWITYYMTTKIGLDKMMVHTYRKQWAKGNHLVMQ